MACLRSRLAAKRLDEALVLRLAREHEVLITMEEGSSGGFASVVMTSVVMTCLAKHGVFDKGLRFRPMTLPDIFIDHDSLKKQIEMAGLCPKAIVATALSAFGLEERIEQPARA